VIRITPISVIRGLPSDPPGNKPPMSEMPEIIRFTFRIFTHHRSPIAHHHITVV
jgi:hypothetical protein